MDIRVIASGSKGNAYIIEHGGRRLLLEAGVSIKAIIKALSYSIDNLDGALISHEHMDHAKAVRDLIRLGIDCYMSGGTIDALGINSHRLIKLRGKRQVRIGPWVALPFDLIHDAREPLGFMLAIDGYKLLYASDTGYIPYTYSGLTHIMVECNYGLDILKENIENGTTPVAIKNRLMRSHMNIDTVRNFLLANDLSMVSEIILIHMSGTNSDEARFKAEIQELTGKIVRIA